MTTNQRRCQVKTVWPGTPSANAMFATIPGCNRGVTTGKRIAIRRALSTNRNEIADEIFHTLRAAVDLAAMSPYGPKRQFAASQPYVRSWG